jgi:amidase
MARTVRDAALLLEVLAGPDEQDAATLAPGRLPAGSISAPPRRHALRGARLGVVSGPFGLDPRLKPELDEAVAALKSAGAEIICYGDFPKFLKLDDPEREVLLYEFKAGINSYLASLGPTSPMKSLDDLIAYNRAHVAQEMPYFKQEIFVLAEAKGPLSEPAYREAAEACRRISRTEGIDYIMDKYRLDALVALTGPPAWLIDRSRAQGTPTLGGSAQPAAVAGYPSVTVPAAPVDGMPVGLSFFGRPWSEPLLLALAANFEAATQERQGPKFLPHAPVKVTKHSAGMPVPWE